MPRLLIGYRIKNLRQVREELGLSQRQLAATCGISERTLSTIESSPDAIVRGMTLGRIKRGLSQHDPAYSDRLKTEHIS
jgi:predicted transcriptional regulator